MPGCSKTIRSLLRIVIFGLLGMGFLPSLSMGEVRGITTVQGQTPADYVTSQTGKDWAVVVGIDDYKKVRRLKYAVKDAKGIAKVLRKQGFHVKTLFNDQATRHAILKELGSNLIAKVKPEDRVLVFYAGHGETWGVSKDRTMGYLVPVEGQSDALVATGISMGHIRELTNIVPARHVLFLMDVCYGGIAGQQFRSISPLTESYIKVITREQGRQLITAGGADQQAIEGPVWGHSVFTYYLLEGLGKGLADLNDDGIIPATELYTYLDQRVYTAAQLTGHTQRPELWSLSAEKGEFVFLGKSSTDQTAKSRSVPPTQTENDTNASEVIKLRDELARLQSQLDQMKKSEIVEPKAKPTAKQVVSEKKSEVVEPKAKPKAKQVESGKKSEALPQEKDSDRLDSHQQACKQGNVEGCFQLARLYVLGEGVDRDMGLGASLFEKACRAGENKSCTALGSLYWMGTGVPVDRKLAIALWKHACKGGNEKACELLKEAGGAAG